MQFLYPWFFLLSFFIAAVILFYFFRKQYEERKIPSNLLWEQVLNEWQASPWLKKLQQNLLFWLQILALLLLMFALIRPFWMQNDLQGNDLILIVDTSASMSAEYGNATRFIVVKEELGKLADKLNGQEVTIIRAGPKPEILLSKETDKSQVNQTIDELELSYNHESMENTVNLAVSLATGKETAIHIFSDSVSRDVLSEVEQYVEVHNIGKETSNLAIISFGVAPVSKEISGVAVLENQSKKEQEVTFEIHSENELLFEEKVRISGQEEFVVQIPSLPEKPYYEARIKEDDGYQADNELTSIYTDNNPAIFTIGDINPFVVKGFQTIGVEVLQTEVKNVVESMNGIFITHSNSLSELPKMPLILFNSSEEKIKLTEPIVAENDSLLKYVDHESIYIDSAVKELEGEWETILKSGSVPLIQKGKHDGQPLIVVNFGLTDSDWPLQPSFPIFLYNSYQWLSQQTNFLGYFSPGEEKWLNVSEGSPTWAIFDGEDENLYTLDLSKESFKAPFLPGTYQAVAGDKINYFSVLIDDREKLPSFETSFKMNELKSQGKSEIESRNDVLWFWLAFIGLLFIALEWEVYRRGFRG
ncbi:vWA domain-containing protein [Litchfieldia salsa]|uniref:von Willebrand factor type A domain-containing protein n=1 Tax=Litchfieldia salsa TaxID=930152 RepID=A0A1H0WMP3_9BACI|nr:BatA and WFA domain-containing protein [Litchfieldia salsa]SDP91990.1 von Willebrand factor type A domain-containing protein [Litchfieldia salsa]